VDTCGHVDSSALLDVAPDTDLFLFDLKMMDEERHRTFTGASNVRILQNLERLAAVHGNVLVRFPFIPGVNDDDVNVRAIGAFLASLRLTRVDVLPYHRAGLAKYERLQRPYELPDTRPPSNDHVTHAVRLLESCGLIVRPGGSS
jgi:pyruvate formate lyase activating enzyme